MFNSNHKSQDQVDKPNYTSEEVNFKSVGVTLEGTLYLPSNGSRVIGVVMVGGSGSIDRDGKNKNDPTASPPIYKYWANYLASNKVAVLRYDKRFYKYPQFDSSKITQKGQIDDIVAALTYLKSRSEIINNRLFIIGHSEGGSIAPVAIKETSFVLGLIIIASPCFAVDELLIEQLKAKSEIDLALVKQTGEAFLSLRSNQFPREGKIWGISESYWREWIEYTENAERYLLSLNKYVLIQQGLADENFPSYTLQKNITCWENIVNQSDKLSFKTYENVTHLLLQSHSQKIATNVLNDILSFVNRIE